MGGDRGGLGGQSRGRGCWNNLGGRVSGWGNWNTPAPFSFLASPPSQREDTSRMPGWPPHHLMPSLMGLGAHSHRPAVMHETHLPPAHPHLPPPAHHMLCSNHTDLSVLGTLGHFLLLPKPSHQLRILPKPIYPQAFCRLSPLYGGLFLFPPRLALYSLKLCVKLGHTAELGSSPSQSRQQMLGDVDLTRFVASPRPGVVPGAEEELMSTEGAGGPRHLPKRGPLQSEAEQVGRDREHLTFTRDRGGGMLSCKGQIEFPRMSPTVFTYPS